MTAAVEARALTKRYGTVEAVRGIDLDVPAGRTFGFLGPNGAGKTTTMKMIYGVAIPDAGTLRVLGLDVRRDARAVKRRVGVVPQEPNLDADMEVRDTLVSHARFYDVTGAAARRRADELLRELDLEDKARARVDQLSGGMKRRLLIARALVNDPDLLILDEPTVGLDPVSRTLLWDKIRAFRRSGRTVLLTTHYMDEAEKLCDELAVVDDGRIVTLGRPRELVERDVGREVLDVELARAEDEPRLHAIAAGARSVHRRAGEFHIATDAGERLLADLLASGIETPRAVLRRATLDDLFLMRTGRSLEGEDGEART